jgi:hypothetical protein
MRLDRGILPPCAAPAAHPGGRAPDAVSGQVFASAIRSAKRGQRETAKLATLPNSLTPMVSVPGDLGIASDWSARNLA